MRKPSEIAGRLLAISELVGGPDRTTLVDAAAILTDHEKAIEAQAFVEPHHEDIVAHAAELYEDEGSLEFDPGALVSEGDANGAYVACWKWVDFAGTPWDKEKEDDK